MLHQRLFDKEMKPPSTAVGARQPEIDPIRVVEEAVRSVLGVSVRQRATRPAQEAMFAERLFSLRHVEALLPGTREVRVAPGTVITPLAQHALKQLGIGVRFVSKSEISRAQRKGEWGFAIESRSGIVSAVRRALLDESESWLEAEGFTDLLEWLPGAGDRGGVYLTENAPVAVWRACRKDGIRAASAESCDGVDRAVQGLGLNLLVIEPAGKSISLMKQLCGTLRKRGAPSIPEDLEGT